MELSSLTRHVPVWHLTILSLVSFFQVKLTGTFPDHEALGHPIEATLSGLLCVGHSASRFVSTDSQKAPPPPRDKLLSSVSMCIVHGSKILMDRIELLISVLQQRVKTPPSESKHKTPQPAFV